MDRDSVERLRHDRRLVRRREWVSDEDRASYLESLPDVSDKMTRGFDGPDDEADSNASEAAATAPAFDGPSVSPSFGASGAAAGSPSDPQSGSTGGSSFS